MNDRQHFERGMAWWNSLSHLERHRWLRAAGPNASVDAAYREYLVWLAGQRRGPFPEQRTTYVSTPR